MLQAHAERDQMSDGVGESASDIPRGNWVDRLVPPTLRPYLRLERIDRPIGIWLLMFPCWWGVALASSTWPDPWLLFLFAIGALLMRGAGCTLNDIADRDFDARVERTRSRPIPSGQVSVKAAFAFLVLQALIGLLVLIQFDAFTIWLGIASLVVVTLGVVAPQVNYALSDRVLTPNCIDQQISPEDNGAIGVCNIVEALDDPLTTGSLYVGIALGALALALGILTYRRMDTERRRDHAITGAVLG